MTDRGIPKTLLIVSVLLDLAILQFFLFMPRTGLETLAIAYVLFPMTVIRAGIAISCLYLSVKRRAWPSGVYTGLAVIVTAWFWFVGLDLEPTSDPLHEVLRLEARAGAERFKGRVDTLIYDGRRARQRGADPDHARLCDLMAEERDLDALAMHPRRSANGLCITMRGTRVSPLLHAVTYSYGAWSGDEIPLPPIDETYLAPAAELLLAAGADPDAQDEYDNTALHYALTFRDEPLLDVLLASDACLLLPNALGESPLRTHSTHSLRKKIEAAANNPDALSRCPRLERAPDQSPAPSEAEPLDVEAELDFELVRALRSGRLETALELLRQGANPDASDREDSSFEAALRNCRDNHLTMAQALLDAGADIDLGNQRGHTPLRIAFDHCRAALPFLLERGADPRVADRRGDTVLHYLSATAAEDAEPLLARMLAAGAEIDQRNRSGQTPLLRAVSGSSGHYAAALALLEHGADPGLADGAGDTSLHLLARRATDAAGLPLLRALLARGAALEQRNERQETPLITAVEHGNAGFVRLLVDAGADVDVRRARGSPLIGALISCDAEKLAKLEALIDGGADVDARSEHGPLPLAQALYGKLYLDCLDPAQLLLSAGAEPNLRDRNGGAPIHGLAHWSEKDPGPALVLLQAHGAQIDLPNDQGRTALLLSARHGSSLRTLERLLAHGADSKLRDERGNTLLHLLAENSEPGVEERLVWALALGADPQARNASGETPLDRARRQRNEIAIRYLEAL